MIPLQLILDHVCLWFNVDAGDVRGPRRYKSFATARLAFYHLATKHTGLTAAKIAGFLWRDRSTITQGRQSFERRLLDPDEGPGLLLILGRIEQGLGIRHAPPRMEMTWMAA